MLIEIRNEIRDRVRLGWFQLQSVEVRALDPSLVAATGQRTEELRQQFPDAGSASATLEPARRLYRGLGIDPSRRRPASEALLRRVLQGKGLPTVNTAVDAANLTSLTIFLPVGLYDADRLEIGSAGVRLTLGDAGDAYEGIGKGEVHLAERPVLKDESGPFGNPSSDSLRTAVTERTRSLLFVLYCPADQPLPDLERALDASAAILMQFLGGTKVASSSC